MKLVVFCVECGARALAPFEKGIKLRSNEMYRQIGWVLSLIDPPEVGKPDSGTLAPLCGECTKKVYPPAVLKVATEQLVAKKN